MRSAAFSQYTDISLTLIGLGLFVIVFIGSIVWVSLKENSLFYKKIAKKIFDEGEQL